MCCVFVVVSKQVQEQHVGSIASVRAEHAPLARSACLSACCAAPTQSTALASPIANRNLIQEPDFDLRRWEMLGENFSEKLKVPVALYYS